MKALATTVLLSTVSYGAMAQNSRNLSMDEAIKLTVQNSKQLKLSHAKVDEATAMYHEAWNNHLPDVKVSGAYLRIKNPTVDLKVKLGGSSSDTSKKSSGSSINVDQAMYGMVNASLPLFSGFRIKYGVESAKYLEEAAKLDVDHDKEEVVLNAINAYNNLYKASKSVDLVVENLKQQEQRVKDFSNLEKNGLLARNDLLKAQLQQANIELTLLDARNNLKIATVNMNLMLGLPETTELVPDNNVVMLTEEPEPLTKWELAATQYRKDMASLAMREKAAVSGIKSAKGEYYPGIALTGGYVAADIPNVVTITNALNVGLGLQYNLGALWKTGAKVAQSEARLHQLQASEELLADQIKVQINQAYENYYLSLKKIEVYARAIGQAGENYRITKNKYDNSLVTTTDLLEADVAQLQAKLNFAFAQADAVVAYKKLQESAGMLTDNLKPSK
jgi:outer membrane protein TolC